MGDSLSDDQYESCVPVNSFLTNGPILLPEDSVSIHDADEEIFLIYTALQGLPSQDQANLRGLGFLDSKRDVVELRFNLTGLVAQPSSSAASRKGKKNKRAPKEITQSVEYQLLQDKTALRSRKGDTGSVVWKASIDFGRFVLQEHKFPSARSLFDSGKLKHCHVLELGAGTGLLSLIFSPLVQRYTVTDTADLIGLIQKNVKHNYPGWPNISEGSPGANIAVESLDWIELQTCSHAGRKRLLTNIPAPIDVLLVVDCIYHPNLIPPLLAAIDHLSTPDHTQVLVLSELRSEEVLREFLEGWMNITGWNIWHIGGDLLEDQHYVLWVGQKQSLSDS